MLIDKNYLPTIREKYKDKKIVLSLGGFDLFHYEHLRYLQDAKKLGDILIVAIKEDEVVKLKGYNRPYVNEVWRSEIINGLKCVDYVLIARKEDVNVPDIIKNNKSTFLWWQLFSSIFEELKPDLLYYEENEELQPARELASKLFKTSLVGRKRTELTSTTKIIKKIKDEK